MTVSSSGSSKGISFSINRNLSKAQESLSSSFQKLSSGVRINRASDDAAGLAIVASLDASIVSLQQASRNIGDLSSFTEIADGALGQISDLATRQSELAAQAANGTYSDQQRSALQQEYQSISEEINRIAATTEFNGTKVFQGGSVSGQVGEDGSSNSELSIRGTDISTLAAAVSASNIGTQAGAQSALETTRALSEGVASKRGELGASQTRLDSASDAVESRRISQQGARSRIADLDVAEEAANAIKAQILSNSGTALLAQASKLNSNTVKLLLG